MTRFHATPQGDVPFTPEEEAERDAEEAQAALASQRAAVPDEVPMAAARKVLRAKGIKDADVRTAIANSAMTDAQKEDALIDWEFEPVVHRASPLVAGLGAALGLSEAQKDELFIAAGA